ncbi:MAG: Gfo/Idh/MocA family oxidoreductase [Verrucomicrobiae bacterium]|nr:Gfo/Idh/MocA family oxidoreductase [Verrucomicrobiae bacterium]
MATAAFAFRVLRRGATAAPEGGSSATTGEPVHLAAVGIGGIGKAQIPMCVDAGFRVTALCDIDDVYASPMFEKYPGARRYRDFREMFETEGDKIDAVYIGTPDHTHAIVALEALRRKKHVLCVKPLTRTIEEARALVGAARRAGVATQMTASPAWTEPGCRTCELIWGGAIGDVEEVHIWSDRPLWPQGMERPPGEDPVPGHFDWKAWLGPAPSRPFKHKWPEKHYAIEQIVAAGGMNKRPAKSKADDYMRAAVYHPWNFRGWYDFGTGALGDMGCHHFNTPRRALKLGHPEAVSASCSRLMGETWPLASIVTWEYPAREGMPPVRVIWYDGGLKPPRPPELEWDRALPKDGNLYVGRRGKMLVSGSGGVPRLIPESKMQSYTQPPKTLERRSGIYGEWMEAIRGGPAPTEDWATCAGPLSEMVLLGNIAVRVGGYLKWDGPNMRFTNSEEANALVRANYQNGWRLDA